MKCCRCCKTKQGAIITGVVGIFVILAGVALLGGFIAFTKNSVIKDVRLVPGTVAYDTFEEMPVPIKMQYWVWDMKNPDEFLEGEKPIMAQQGPYTYLEYRQKFNISHDHVNGTVGYQSTTNYIFVPEESAGLESDTFFTVNIPVFTVANLLKDQPGPIKNIQRLIHELSNATSILELTVYDILWGYEDAYLLLFDELFPGQIPTTKFGLFAGTNASIGQPWVLSTGENDISTVGNVVTWDGLTELDYWSTEWANMINGSDGTTTPPFKRPEDEIYVYVPQICRSGYLSYTYASEMQGIPTGHYEIGPELFANVSINPDNIGFCYPDADSCHPTGLVNAEPCKDGAPIYFSLPHFLYGDQSLLDGVIGMEPDSVEHSLSFDVEMLTGIVFGVNNRVQVNLKVQPYSYVPDTIAMPTVYVPVLWLNESSAIDAANAEFFQSTIIVPLLIARVFIGLLLGVGVLMIIGAIVGYCCYCKKEKDLDKETVPITTKSEAFAESETKFDYGAM